MYDDGFIQYDNQPDVFDRRRLTRAEYALSSLPALAFALFSFALSWGLMWAAEGRIALGRASGAVALWAWASFAVFRHQKKQLMRRCQDAERHYAVQTVIMAAAAGLALLNGIFTFYGKPMILAVLLLLVYGIVLPDNAKPNLHGAARLPNPMAQKGQWLAYVLACILLILLMR